MIQEPAYYATIPAPVRYDKSLPAAAKLLYGEITALCTVKGYCWAGNGYFAELYDVSKDTVSVWINKLDKLGYVRIEIDRKAGNIRRIYLSEKIAIPIEKNRDTYREKSGEVSGKIAIPIEKNREQSITVNNTESKREKEYAGSDEPTTVNPPPQKGQSVRSVQYTPEFEAIWRSYAKPSASKPKAFVEWQRLSATDQAQAISRLPDYLRHQPEARYRKDPERWFRDRGFENDYSPPPSGLSRPPGSASVTSQFKAATPD